MDTISVYECLERLGGLLRGDTRMSEERGLQPVQFTALYFLTICNHYSDTPLGVTDYLGLTKGTVSQSLKVLERKGLIGKFADLNDKRLLHLKVTARGRALVRQVVPPTFMKVAAKNFSQKEWQNLAYLLRKLLRQSQVGNGARLFGQCNACRFNQVLGSGKYLCGLTEEPLTKAQTTQICREYQEPVARPR